MADGSDSLISTGHRQKCQVLRLVDFATRRDARRQAHKTFKADGLIGLRYAALTTILYLHSLGSSHQSGMT
ncbi:hypothetical protein DND67_21885 [Pseudomonas syringae pv. pisi]|nr:hypothetical protein DND67_21885 [Pseudomonas syringae pv. pisi]